MISLDSRETIAAVSTPLGEGGIGIVRISGPAALDCARTLFLPYKSGAFTPEDRRMHYGHAVSPTSREILDEVLFVYMKAPHTYTREDVVEIHGHGGPLATRRVLEAAVEAGARVALPGEFTRRAFLNGRIDLARAEAVLDIIRSRTEGALGAAVAQLDGALSSRVRRLRTNLLTLIANIEAIHDFPDEDIPVDSIVSTGRELQAALREIQALLDDERRNEVYRDGFGIALVGKPNVGKSTLLNVLLGHERALVTEIPGTTRDSLEEWLNIEGVPVRIIDTAGLRPSTDRLENLGMARTMDAIDRADLILFLLDMGSAVDTVDRSIFASLPALRVIVVANKCDLDSGERRARTKLEFPSVPIVETVLFGDSRSGVDELCRQMVRLILSEGLELSQERLSRGARHLEVLLRARGRLEDARLAVEDGQPHDLACIGIRSAIEALGEITGETFSEDLLDAVFSRFCIGK